MTVQATQADSRMAGMKPRQRDIAEEVRRRGRCTLREVAIALDLSNNGVSQTADTLFARDLIRRVDDQRIGSSVLDDPIQWIAHPAPVLFP